MIRKGIHPSVVIDTQGKLNLPDSTIIEPLSCIFAGLNSEIDFGEQNTIYPHCSFRVETGFIRTGREVSFGPGCHIYEPREGLIIGDYTMIAGGTLICGVEHGSAELDVPMRHQMVVAKPIVIESNVWIGMAVKILPGVTIGKGSIIGAGSVVTRSIPSYSIAIGAPCKVTRERIKREETI